MRAAELLAGSLEPSVRLCLLEALSDATAEITTKLDSATVEVRLRGRDAALVVTEAPQFSAPAPTAPPGDAGDLARVTLRLPQPLKEQVEHAATAEGITVNAWLVRAISSALYAGPQRPPAPPMPLTRGGRPDRGRPSVRAQT
jgi:hypothetical protein